MHKTANEIIIQGDPDRIFAVAAAVEEWPEWLPHYRRVRIHGREGNRRTVEMAAWRTRIPVRWVSYQWLWPEERRITFRHIGGLSRGMEVEWRIEPVQTADGRRQTAAGTSECNSGAADSAPGRSELPSTAYRLASACVRVSITHELRLEVPVVRSGIGQWVVGELFVRAVAGRTLACLKQQIEGEP